MTHLVASITLDSARSCVIQGEFLTQGTISSIPTVLSWGGSIRPEVFWPSILLLTVIIVAIAIVTAILLVVAVIIGIVDVVVGVPSIIKLSFLITGWTYAFHQDKASSIRVPVANFTSIFSWSDVSIEIVGTSMVATCAFSAVFSTLSTSLLEFNLQFVKILLYDHPTFSKTFYVVFVGNKMHKAFPLPEESSHWQYKFPLPVKVVPTARRLEMPLSGVCTAIEEMMKKLPVKDK
nr:hypothetical protein [Tanacetum cinerariifolium]